MSPSNTSRVFCAAAALALSASACGDLDNMTTVKDLRVLAVRTDPAGFLVPLDDPSSLKDTTAKVTALVVDPQQPNGTMIVTSQSCPDFIDTITAASGKPSKLCPGPDVTDTFPAPLDTILRTTPATTGSAMPVAGTPFQYEPQTTFGLTPEQVSLFFMNGSTGVKEIDQSVGYNRDFGTDAIVNLSFSLGDESTAAIKRLVYWPLLAPENLTPAPNPDPSKPSPTCPTSQVVNQNPDLEAIDLFHRRADGIPTDAYDRAAMPALSLANGDQLFVQPVFTDALAEHYFLRVRNAETNVVETQCRKELLTFQFFATAGTFEPAERTSELPVFLTPPDNGHIPTDSQWKAPKKSSDLPADGHVTLWVVTRDERGGVSFASRAFVVAQ
jgi:hypothetical protein